MTCLRHGDEMSIKGGRGLGEPSLALFTTSITSHSETIFVAM